MVIVILLGITVIALIGLIIKHDLSLGRTNNIQPLAGPLLYKTALIGDYSEGNVFKTIVLLAGGLIFFAGDLLAGFPDVSGQSSAGIMFRIFYSLMIIVGALDLKRRIFRRSSNAQSQHGEGKDTDSVPPH